MNRLESIGGQLKNPISKNFLKDRVVVVTGGSRGIGLAIGRQCAKFGAKVAILAKTTEEDPRLPGTIYTAAKEIEAVGGQALPLVCDIRNEKGVEECIKKVVEKWGRIDILVNNASAISMTGTADTTMKKYDLMHNVNTRGTFLLSKTCLPYLKKSPNPHILNISPPLSMDKKWFSNHVAYTMAKYGMSMCVLGMAEEFQPDGIAVNALWPRTAIATAAVKNLLGGNEMMRTSRTDQIMADAAIVIFSKESRKTSGNFFIDQRILREQGVKDFKHYKVDPSVKDEDLTPDFFLDWKD